MGLAERVKMVLEEALGPSEYHLDTSASGRVGGVVVADAFEGKSQTERQEMIWDALRAELKPDERIQVMALLTMTTSETSDIDAVAGAAG